MTYPDTIYPPILSQTVASILAHTFTDLSCEPKPPPESASGTSFNLIQEKTSPAACPVNFESAPHLQSLTSDDAYSRSPKYICCLNRTDKVALSSTTGSTVEATSLTDLSPDECTVALAISHPGCPVDSIQMKSSPLPCTTELGPIPDQIPTASILPKSVCYAPAEEQCSSSADLLQAATTELDIMSDPPKEAMSEKHLDGSLVTRRNDSTHEVNDGLPAADVGTETLNFFPKPVSLTDIQRPIASETIPDLHFSSLPSMTSDTDIAKAPATDICSEVTSVMQSISSTIPEPVLELGHDPTIVPTEPPSISLRTELQLPAPDDDADLCSPDVSIADIALCPPTATSGTGPVISSASYLFSPDRPIESDLSEVNDVNEFAAFSNSETAELSQAEPGNASLSITDTSNTVVSIGPIVCDVSSGLKETNESVVEDTILVQNDINVDVAPLCSSALVDTSLSLLEEMVPLAVADETSCLEPLADISGTELYSPTDASVSPALNLHESVSCCAMDMEVNPEHRTVSSDLPDGAADPEERIASSGSDASNTAEVPGTAAVVETDLEVIIHIQRQSQDIKHTEGDKVSVHSPITKDVQQLGNLQDSPPSSLPASQNSMVRDVEMQVDDPPDLVEMLEFSFDQTAAMAFSPHLETPSSPLPPSSPFRSSSPDQIFSSSPPPEAANTPPSSSPPAWFEADKNSFSDTVTDDLKDPSLPTIAHGLADAGRKPSRGIQELLNDPSNANETTVPEGTDWENVERPRKRLKLEASLSPPRPPNPKRPTLASQQQQRKKLAAPFRSPLVDAAAVRHGLEGVYASGRAAPRAHEGRQSSAPSAKSGPENKDGGACQREAAAARKDYTANAAKQFKSPLCTGTRAAGPACPSAASSSSHPPPPMLSLSGVRATPTIQALQGRVQMLKQAIRIRSAGGGGGDLALAALARKWREAAREVAWAMWDTVKDMDLGESVSVGRGKGGWFNEEYGGGGSKSGKQGGFKEGWGFNEGRKGKGAFEGWGWDEGKKGEDAGEVQGQEQTPGEEEEEEGGVQTAQHTLGTMLRHLSIAPDTLGWDEDEGDFVDDTSA
ncbi:hypothetical protein AcW2_006437 [Taiwanofungus camphoratus]|nr:hypothetical protein AcW2_006437 [Antrodia cinnamomea]